MRPILVAAAIGLLSSPALAQAPGGAGVGIEHRRHDEECDAHRRDTAAIATSAYQNYRKLEECDVQSALGQIFILYGSRRTLCRTRFSIVILSFSSF